MMDILTSAPLLNGVGVVAVVLGGGFAFVRAINRGDLITKREAELYQKRAESAESQASTLREQQDDMREVTKLLKAVLEALRKGAGP